MRMPTNPDIAVLALYRLGGAETRVHTEDVALECYRLAQPDFSWRKYPEHPDCEPARLALEDARKPKNGRRVSRTGTAREGGWMLTPTGVQWVREHGDQATEVLGVADLRSERQYARRAVSELTSHAAFRRFASERTCEGVSEVEFVDSLRCTLNTSPKVLRARLEEEKTRATEVQAHDVVAYLVECENTFSRLLEVNERVVTPPDQSRKGGA